MAISPITYERKVIAIKAIETRTIETNDQETLSLRTATKTDIPAISELIEDYRDKLLPRTSQELVDLIGSFLVVENGAGEVVGCCCLEIYSPKIAELRTLAVKQSYEGRGLGRRLVDAALEIAQKQNIHQVLVVTSNREFFERMNFGPALNEKYALFWYGPESKTHQ